MKTFIFSILVLFGTVLSSCQKKFDSTKIDMVVVSKNDSIKTKKQSITFLKSLNKKNILQVFFKPIKIIDDTAYWNLDLESLDMLVSDDGYLHTVIDSIFTINDRLLILFTTYDIAEDGTINGCHPCGVDYSIALLEKSDTGYTILRFKKHLISTGCFGYGAGGKIVSLGKLNNN